MKLYCYTFLLLLLCFTLVIEAAKKQPKRHPKKQVPKKIKPNKEVPNNEVPQKQVPKKVTSKPKSAPKPATKEAPKKVTSKPKSPKKTTKKPSVHLDDSARVSSKFTRGELLKYLETKPTLWKNKYIADGKKQYYKRLLGGFAPTKHDLHIASIARLNQTTNDDIFMRQVFEEMPKSFDARKKWPDCPTIAEIQDQSRCGADWAVSSAAAMADRACIGSNKERKPHISATDLMSCCTDCRGTAEDGCQGGYAYRAWIFYTNKGIVTGGEFGSNQGCRPYTFGASNSPKVKGGYSSPECLKQCKDGKDYYAEKHYGIDVVYPDTVETIQQEIYKNGPLTAYMEVHEDLISYQSGIYKESNQFKNQIGSHNVRILGWDENANGVPYWIIANSWGTDWGKNGTFKMIRGINHLSIENFAVAGKYDYSRSVSNSSDEEYPDTETTTSRSTN